jgi:O-antigen/teichoic acid export membrane protein
MSAAPPADASEAARPPHSSTATGHSVVAPALRGTALTLAGYGAAQVLRLAGNLVLTRLLFPEAFGLMAIVNIFVQGLAMFSDVGIGPAIIQSPRGDDPDFLNTAWTIQCVRGVLLWACSFVIAWPVAAFYEQAELRWLIPAAAFSAVIGGVEATSMHGLQRHLKLGLLTLVELAGQGAGIIATVLLVLVHRHLYGPAQPGAIWAVVLGSLAGVAVRTVLSFVALPGVRHRFLLERPAMRALLGFGRWIFLSTLLTFLGSQADRLLFGKLIPFDVLGVYSIAAMLAALPTQAILKLGAAVVFPMYSRMVGRADFRRVFLRVRLPLLLGGGMLVSGLIAAGPSLVRVLYDRRYAEAGWILQYLAVGAWLQVLECTNGAALLAKGRVAWVAAGSAAKLVGLVVLIPVGFHLAGFPGALAGLVGADLVKYLTSALGAARSGLHGFWRDVGLTALTLAIAGAGLASAQALSARQGSNLGALLVAGAVPILVWAVVAGPPAWRERKALVAGWRARGAQPGAGEPA